jgi:hypothetical protein
MMMWHKIENSPFNWVSDFGKSFESVALPELTRDTIYIATDFSGSHKESSYEVISMLYMDAKASLNWELARQRWRSEYLPDLRSLSFKDLGDHLKQAALVPFLSITKEITGIVVSIVISKQVNNIWCDKALFDMAAPLRKGKWNAHFYEKAFCIAHFVSVLIAGLSQPNQNIYWMSDEDDILANPDKIADVALITSAFTSRYTPHPLGKLNIETTAMSSNLVFFEDLCAIPDLAAGSLCEVVNFYASHNSGSLPRNENIHLGPLFSDKTNTVARWTLNSTVTFKQIRILIDKDAGGIVRMATMEIKDA